MAQLFRAMDAARAANFKSDADVVSLGLPRVDQFACFRDYMVAYIRATERREARAPQDSGDSGLRSNQRSAQDAEVDGKLESDLRRRAADGDSACKGRFTFLGFCALGRPTRHEASASAVCVWRRAA